MKIDHYLKKIKETAGYKKLIKEDPKAYLCSAFFVRDFKDKHNETHVDFYSPKIKKIISFKVDGKAERIPIDKKAETMTHKIFVPPPLFKDINLEIEKIRPIILDEMHNRGLTDDVQKILVILQNLDQRDVWNCTCFLSGMGLLQSHVEDKSASVLFMEKRSFFDIIKFVGGQDNNISGKEGKIAGNEGNIAGKDESVGKK
jgi:hypothetical protein